VVGGVRYNTTALKKLAHFVPDATHSQLQTTKPASKLHRFLGDILSVWRRRYS